MSDRNFKQITPSNPGLFRDLLLKAKLVYRLMGDKRVNPFLKFIPIGSLAYLIFPADLLPFLPFDDIAVVGMGVYLFIELCPQHVVEEHLTNLKLVVSTPFKNSDADDLVIDGEVKEVDNNTK